jgi:hypothetical protein
MPKAERGHASPNCIGPGSRNILTSTPCGATV